jgi:hypothetical protein
MILTCSSRFIAALFFALLASESKVSAYKIFLGKMNYKLAVAVGASMLILNPDLASAQVDCNRNCLQNCTKVAPGSIEYCKSSCTEYCEQTDRLGSLPYHHTSKNTPVFPFLIFCASCCIGKMVYQVASTQRKERQDYLEEASMGQWYMEKISLQKLSSPYLISY